MWFLSLWFHIYTHLIQITVVYPGPMRNYTNGYHPAGGADPRYLNYDSGIVVPNLINPRIPDSNMALKPRHHLEKYIGVRPGKSDYEYDEVYYDGDDEVQITDEYHAEKEFSSTSFMSPTRNAFFFEVNGSGTSKGVYSQSDETNDIPEGSTNDEYGSGENTTQRDVELPLGRGKVHCRDGGRGYRSGDVFIVAKDPCTRCRCDRFGPQCNKTVCDPLPRGCSESLRRPDECCPICLKMGCSFGGAIISVNETLQITACETCECKEDGRLYCSVADCSPPLCVDARIEATQCCPVCPNGPNCYTSNNIIIPATNNWVAHPNNHCVVCRCRQTIGSKLLWMANRTAQCKHDEHCEN